MYHVTKEWIYGYAMLPCFKVKTIEGSLESELICSDFLATIFEWFFLPFWDGMVKVTKVVKE